MTDAEKRVIEAAKNWARAERRLREVNYYKATWDKTPAGIAADSDITEQTLLAAVDDLEKPRGMVLTFFGEKIEVGTPISSTMYEWLKGQVPKGPSWWSIR